VRRLELSLLSAPLDLLFVSFVRSFVGRLVGVFGWLAARLDDLFIWFVVCLFVY
jgi:hypothetical protein